MSFYELNRLFGAIKTQYEIKGTIDHHQKALLSEGMKKFSGAENFIQEMSKAFQEIENSDDDSTGYYNEYPCDLYVHNSKISIVKPNIFRRFRFQRHLEAKSVPNTQCMESSTISADAIMTLKFCRYKLNFNVALKVFHSFQFSCYGERSTVHEQPKLLPTIITTDSTSTDLRASASTKTEDV